MGLTKEDLQRQPKEIWRLPMWERWKRIHADEWAEKKDRWARERKELLESASERYQEVVNKNLPKEEREAYKALQNAKGHQKNQMERWEDFILSELPREILTEAELKEEYPNAR